jgi:hypothetical protein
MLWKTGCSSATAPSASLASDSICWDQPVAFSPNRLPALYAPVPTLIVKLPLLGVVRVNPACCSMRITYVPGERFVNPQLPLASLGTLGSVH